MMAVTLATLAARPGAQAGAGVWVPAAFLFPALSVWHDRTADAPRAHLDRALRLRLHFLGPGARVFG